MGYLRILGSKSKKGRPVPLNTKACIALAHYFKERKVMTNSALFSNRFAEKLSARGVEKIVSKYLFQAGIRDANVQSLRHTFAIQHIISGAKLKVIQEVMGYIDSRTTSMYSFLVKDKVGMELQEHTL